MLSEDVAPGKLMCAYYSTLNQWSRAHIIDVQDSMVRCHITITQKHFFLLNDAFS